MKLAENVLEYNRIICVKLDVDRFTINMFPLLFLEYEILSKVPISPMLIYEKFEI